MLDLAAAGANEDRHVFDDADQGNVHLLEHSETLLRINERNVLRSRHDDGARQGRALRELQLNVARSRGHVDDEVVEVVPVGKREELIERARGHRTAPDHRFILVDHEADGIDLNAVRLKRLHGLAVDGHRLPVSAEHGGLRGAIDVGIKNAHFGAFVAERKRKVGRHRRLADAALAG